MIRALEIGTLAVGTLLLTACFGGRDDTGTGLDPRCGDVDGDGTDTGDVPNVLGTWSASAAATWFEESCGAGGLDTSSLSFIDGPIEIEGYVPDGLRLIPDGDRDNKLYGMESPHGGLVYTGVRDSAWGTMHVAVSGLAYADPRLDRAVWDGSVFVGVDVDDDGSIDCDVIADFRALKSGT